MARKKLIKLSKKEAKYRLKVDLERANQIESTVVVKQKTKLKIGLPKVIPIRRFGEIIGQDPVLIISTLFKNGISATMNESIDYDTAVLIGDDLGIEISPLTEEEVISKKEDNSDFESRPPVVTIMGHVDHGKTKLLDVIRKTNVIDTESGGITQHIGAYQVEIPHEGKIRKITFLDTPGHAAFSALRAHGANLTDIVILVVSADEGVKPQTIEALSHAKAADVPVIVAINKIDLPGADPEKIKRQLSSEGLLSEDWGGKVPMITVSAKTGQNINQLLEMIILTADVLELRANPEVPASGTIIETNISTGVGILATGLIKQGTLKPGQIIIIGKNYNKIRFIEDWNGRKIKSASPATPVRIAGLKTVPTFGDVFEVVNSEKDARQILGQNSTIGPVQSQVINSAIQEFKLIIKTDVVGSLEAIKTSIKDLSTAELNINIISEGIGDINETDINLAITTNAFIFGFRVIMPKTLEKLANQNKVIVKTYDIIYKMLDRIIEILEGSIKETFSQEVIGKLQVLKLFFHTNVETVLGGKVIQGMLVPNCQAILFRDNIKLGQGKIISLKIGPSDVVQADKGVECGLRVNHPSNIDDSWKVRKNDIIEVMKTTKQKESFNKED